MARIDGIDPERLTDDYTARVLRAQAKAWGAPLRCSTAGWRR